MDEGTVALIAVALLVVAAYLRRKGRERGASAPSVRIPPPGKNSEQRAREKEPSHGAGGTQMPFTSLRAGDQEAVAGLLAALASTRRLGVAFSGGVDSSVLLALAERALGPEWGITGLGL